VFHLVDRPVVSFVFPSLNLLIMAVFPLRISMEMNPKKSTTIVLKIPVVLASALGIVAFLSVLFLFHRAVDLEAVVVQ
jgi:hypothetical protein